MYNRQRSAFPTMVSEWALLPVDVLQRIEQMDVGIGRMSAEDYHCVGERLKEVISDAWTSLLRVRKTFQSVR